MVVLQGLTLAWLQRARIWAGVGLGMDLTVSFFASQASARPQTPPLLLSGHQQNLSHRR